MADMPVVVELFSSINDNARPDSGFSLSHGPWEVSIVDDAQHATQYIRLGPTSLNAASERREFDATGTTGE